jgi:TPP-dependent pyruvate/acetoin dehydrogenase alpha subunit
MTYRYRSHCEGQKPEYMRDPAVIAEWQEKDPIPCFEAYLVERGLLNEADKGRISAAAKAEMDTAIRYAEESPFPPVEELTTGAYAPEDPTLVGGRRI